MKSRASACGHRDQGENSAAAALIRECLVEELRLPATLATRLRKYAALTPQVQTIVRRGATHVVSLWLIPASAAELAAIEQTDDGKSEAHSPAMRTFAEFKAATPYAEALTSGIRNLNYPKLLRRFGPSSTGAPDPPADAAVPVPAPAVAAQPALASDPVPDAAKYERGIWFYRLVYPARGGAPPRSRWFPSSRYSAEELLSFDALRAAWDPPAQPSW